MEQKLCLPTKCRLLPSTGTAPSLPGQSCKHIKDTLANQCSQSPQSGVYWVKVTEQCSGQEQTMQVSEGVEDGMCAAKYAEN